MGIFGAIFGGGGSSPNLAVATNAEAIRDRAIEVIGALVPRYMAGPGNRFRPYLNEGRGNFIDWANANSPGCFRRFQVRTGSDTPPEVSNCDYEERKLVLVVTIAYPQSARTGPTDALDRDDVADQDFKQIDFAIGIYGRANFCPPNPDGMPLGATKTSVRDAAAAVDFLVIEAPFTYQRLTS